MSDAAVELDDTQPRPPLERRARLSDGVNWQNRDHDLQMQMIGLRLKPIEDDVAELKSGQTRIHERFDQVMTALGNLGSRAAPDDSSRSMSTQTMVMGTVQVIANHPIVGVILIGLCASAIGGLTFGWLAWQAMQ